MIFFLLALSSPFLKEANTRYEASHETYLIKNEKGEAIGFGKEGSDRVFEERMGIEKGSALCHELIASSLNLLMDNRFGTPFAFELNGESLHAYIENEGTLYTVFANAPKKWETYKKTLSKKHVQEQALWQILLSHYDARRQNVLVTDKGLITIDFGRMLTPNFGNRYAQVKTTLPYWPFVKEPLNEASKAYFSKLNPDYLIAELKQMVPQTAAVKESLKRLKANLTLIKLAAKKGLSPLEVLNFYLPQISAEDHIALLKQTDWQLHKVEQRLTRKTLEAMGFFENTPFAKAYPVIDEALLKKRSFPSHFTRYWMEKGGIFVPIVEKDHTHLTLPKVP